MYFGLKNKKFRAELTFLLCIFVVSVVARLRANVLEIMIRFLTQASNVSFSRASRPHQEPTQPLIQWVPGSFFSGGKTFGTRRWPLVLGRAKLRNEQSYKSTSPYAVMAGTRTSLPWHISSRPTTDTFSLFIFFVNNSLLKCRFCLHVYGLFLTKFKVPEQNSQFFSQYRDCSHVGSFRRSSFSTSYINSCRRRDKSVREKAQINKISHSSHSNSHTGGNTHTNKRYSSPITGPGQAFRAPGGWGSQNF